MALDIPRRLFTVKEYHQMEVSGILNEDDRIELIEGEIIEMNPIGSRHAACVRGLMQLLFEGVGGRAIVSVQDPIHLNERSEPQPDLALLKPRAGLYRDAHPGPDDILLLVEVADSSLAYDRDVKIPLYARSGIPEVWLVDLETRTIEIHRGTAPNGYGEVVRHVRGARIPIPGMSGILLETDQLLG